MFKDLLNDKRGYERTDIGWLPIDWEVKRLKEIFNEIVVGFVGTISPYYCDRTVGVPFIRTLNVRDGRFDLVEIQYVTKKFHDANRKSQLKNGDILIARVGANMGMTCKVEGLTSEANSANVIIIKKSNLGDSDYYSYVIGSSIGQRQILTQSGGGAQAVFNTGQAQRLIVPYPPLPEQRQIAEILNTWDQAITLTEQLIAAKQRRKKALMQQLLTGRRFREFEGEEWGEVRLGDIAHTFSGGTPSRNNKEYYDGKIPWIKSGELRRANVYTTEECISEEGLKSSSAKIVEKDTILIAMYGATAGVVAITKIEAAINQAILAIVPDKNIINNLYLYYAIFTLTKELLRKVQGSGQPNLNAAILKSSKIRLPLLPEQRKIATVLQACDEEIELLEQKLAALKRQKKGLMQKLLTGQVRVGSLTPDPSPNHSVDFETEVLRLGEGDGGEGDEVVQFPLPWGEG